MKASFVTLWVALSVVGNADNIVVNPGFEDGTTGWGTFQNVSHDNLPGAASEGDWLMRFNGAESHPNGWLWQDITTHPGLLYELEFDLAGHAANQMRVDVVVYDTGLLDPANILAKKQFANPVGGGAYTRMSLKFTAKSTVAKLFFLDVSTATNSTDLLIDNVSVRPLGGIQAALKVRTAPRVELEFQTAAGTAYTVLAGTSPAGPFAPIRKIIGDGNTVTFCDPRDIQERQFYHVVIDD